MITDGVDRFSRIGRRGVIAALAALALAVGMAVSGAVSSGTALAATPAKAPAAWTLRSVPETAPKQPHAQFESVSCPTAKFCMAVGSHVAVDGRYAPVAEIFDGNAWRVSTTALPGSGADGFTSVSCADRTFCLATTSTAQSAGLYRWNGTSWSALQLHTARINDLTDIQCRSRSLCMLIGDVAHQSAAWHFNGHGWYRQHLPAPGGHTLSAVSCPSTAVCYAAGSAGDFTAQTAYVVRWNGKSWSGTSAPKAVGSLADISCVSTTRCTAIGVGGANQDTVLLLDLANGSWRTSTLPTRRVSPGGVAIACTRSACTAILSFDDQNEALVNTIAVRGTRGGFVTSSQSFDNLSGLSCAGTSCVVVGSTLVFDRSGFSIADNPTPATAYRRTGTRLTRMAVPQPDGRVTNALSGVACAGGLCAAVDANADGTHALWLRTSAHATWSPVSGTSTTQYSAVDCASSTFCMAVGRGTSRSYNGSTWAAHAIPTPDGAGNDDIFAVSCVSSAWCDAVGTTGRDGGENKNLVVHWNGTAWTVVTGVPSPAGAAPESALHGISCTSTGNCLAVGYQLGAATPRPLAAQWNGTSWTSVATTGLPKQTLLDAVSCWAASGCMVTSSGEFTDPAVATWNGSAFQVRPLAGDQPTPYAVSCTSASSCTIAGDYFRPGAQDSSQLVEHWTGSAWHIVSQPALIGSSSVYHGISCTPAQCAAVGTVDRAYTIALSGDGPVS